MQNSQRLRQAYRVPSLCFSPPFKGRNAVMRSVLGPATRQPQGRKASVTGNVIVDRSAAATDVFSQLKWSVALRVEQVGNDAVVICDQHSHFTQLGCASKH